MDKSKAIDFRIEWNSESYFFEVKDFQEPARRKARSLSALQPYDPVRERIELPSRKKFKEYKEFSVARPYFTMTAPAMLEDLT